MSWRFAIGESHFAKLIRGQYTFVDKSLFIKHVILDGASVMLFTRPRPFGKTLNMTMLQEFLSLEGDDLFSGLKVSKDTSFCEK